MTRTTCRYPSCDNAPATNGEHRRGFCSTRCEVKHDHIKADAQDRRRTEETQ